MSSVNNNHDVVSGGESAAITRENSSSVSSTVSSSGYGSDQPPTLPQQIYSGSVMQFPQIIQAPAFNPLVFHQSSVPQTNGHQQPLLLPTPAVDQCYSVFPTGQPYTAPVMIATKEQIDYAISHQQHGDNTNVQHHQYRQQSGPIQSAALVTNAQQPFYKVPNKQGPLPGGRGDDLVHQFGEHQPGEVGGVVTAAMPSQTRVKSVGNFSTQKSDPKPPRRSTMPTVGTSASEKKELFRRSAISMKEKSLYEEEHDSTTFTIGEDFGGYDYQFLLSPEDLQEVTCPICQLVLCEPFLTSCCGSQFCRDCVDPLLLKKSSCPMCNHDKLEGMVDRRTERKINGLPVKCTKSSLGCTWTGSLTDLHEHLSQSRGNCDYVTILCSQGCGEEHSLLKMNQHQREECKRRKHQCKFCDYHGIYEDIPEQHWPLCEGYPVPCPHNCSIDDMPRRLLNQHLLECPKRTVKCCFSYAGCSAPLQGDEVRQHMDDNVSVHLNLLSEMVRGLLTTMDHYRRTQQHQPTTMVIHAATAKPDTERAKPDTERDTEILILNQKLNEKESEIKSLKNQVSTLQEDSEETKLELARVKSLLYVPPFKITLTGFSRYRQTSKQWFSAPFYTHSQGYKMCVSVDCNGADEGEGTHVSVYANLMRGEFDDNLTWPFVGVITIQLYNQISENSTHIVHDIPFRKNVSQDISGRVVDQELADSGLGVPQFIAHRQLRYGDNEYLKDDTLRFCVLKTKVL